MTNISIIEKRLLFLNQILTMKIKKLVIKTNSPLVIFKRTCSFSQDEKDAFKASVIFLLVPGVNGNT